MVTQCMHCQFEGERKWKNSSGRIIQIILRVHKSIPLPLRISSWLYSLMEQCGWTIGIVTFSYANIKCSFQNRSGISMWDGFLLLSNGSSHVLCYIRKLFIQRRQGILSALCLCIGWVWFHIFFRFDYTGNEWEDQSSSLMRYFKSEIFTVNQLLWRILTNWQW